MTDFSRLQQVKRRFFAMRNGVIADTYRKAGSPHHIIILCHRLLRHTPFSLDIAIKASDPELTPICRYAAMRLLWHKIYSDAATVRQLAERELATGEPLTSLPARQILDELDYMQNPG